MIKEVRYINCERVAEVLINDSEFPVRQNKLRNKGYKFNPCTSLATASYLSRFSKYPAQPGGKFYTVEWYPVRNPDPKPVQPSTHYTDFGQNPPANAAPEVPFALPENSPNPIPASKTIQDATYTVVRPDGSYRTLKFHTKSEGSLAGKTIVSYLSGPDNETNFTSCAFYNQETGQCSIWRRFRIPGTQELANDILAAVRVVLENPGFAGETYALRSGRCCRCGRKLTVPASIHRGMGPDCAERYGVL